MDVSLIIASAIMFWVRKASIDWDIWGLLQRYWVGSRAFNCWTASLSLSSEFSVLNITTIHCRKKGFHFVKQLMNEVKWNNLKCVLWKYEVFKNSCHPPWVGGVYDTGAPAAPVLSNQLQPTELHVYHPKAKITPVVDSVALIFDLDCTSTGLHCIVILQATSDSEKIVLPLIAAEEWKHLLMILC